MQHKSPLVMSYFFTDCWLVDFGFNGPSGSAHVTNGGIGGMMSIAGLVLPYQRVSQAKFPDETSWRGK